MVSFCTRNFNVWSSCTQKLFSKKYFWVFLKCTIVSDIYEHIQIFVLKQGSNSKVTSQALQVNLVLYVFKLVLYFNSSIFSNQIKYYLAIKRRNFLQVQYDFYRHALQIDNHLWWLVIKKTCAKKEVNVWSVTVGGIMVKGH